MKEKINNQQGEEKSVEGLAEDCLDAQGYLFFTAILTPRRDENDRPIIDFHYRRFHFAIEDAKQALRVLNKAVNDEIEALKGSEEEQALGD